MLIGREERMKYIQMYILINLICYIENCSIRQDH